MLVPQRMERKDDSRTGGTWLKINIGEFFSLERE